MGLEVTTNTLRVRHATHCTMPPLNGSISSKHTQAVTINNTNNHTNLIAEVSLLSQVEREVWKTGSVWRQGVACVRCQGVTCVRWDKISAMGWFRIYNKWYNDKTCKHNLNIDRPATLVLVRMMKVCNEDDDWGVVGVIANAGLDDGMYNAGFIKSIQRV